MTKPLKPITTVQIVTEENDGAAEPVSVNSSKLTNDSILVGYSLGMGMIFEKVVSVYHIIICYLLDHIFNHIIFIIDS